MDLKINGGRHVSVSEHQIEHVLQSLGVDALQAATAASDLMSKLRVSTKRSVTVDKLRVYLAGELGNVQLGQQAAEIVVSVGQYAASSSNPEPSVNDLLDQLDQSFRDASNVVARGHPEALVATLGVAAELQRRLLFLADIKLPVDVNPTPRLEPFEVPDPLDEFVRPERPADPPPDPRSWKDPYFNPDDPLTSPSESTSNAAVFFSDFHMSDGTPGEDFCNEHFDYDPVNGTFLDGNLPSVSRGKLFGQILTFVIQRFKKVKVSELDVVLNGDIIDWLELKGRSGKLWQDHDPIFGILDAAQKIDTLKIKNYYLRGNHDPVVPNGPWTRGISYRNTKLETYAEHGDRCDKSNWAPGLQNYGSKLVVEWLSHIETMESVVQGSQIETEYPMQGLTTFDHSTMIT